MLLLRKFHLYLGTLFAPAIIFFAASGILQVIGLHEAEDADAAQPPAWIVTLASIHKDQHLPRPKTPKPPDALEQMRADHAQEHDPAHADTDAHAHADTDAHTHAHEHAPGAGPDGKPSAEAAGWSQKLLKAFAVMMAIGLILSAVIGIVIAITSHRTRRTAVVMLLLGFVLPLGLLAL